MYFLALITGKSYELVKVGDGQLEADIGKASLGKMAVSCRSGWLQTAEGISFETQTGLSAMVRLKGPSDLRLSGTDMPAALIVREAAGEDRLKYAAGDEAFSIGYASANDIVYRDDSVSRCQGRFYKNGNGQLMYSDMGANSACLNGKRVTDREICLNEGDILSIMPAMNIEVRGGELLICAPAGCARLKGSENP